jgi:hypothetical protein
MAKKATNAEIRYAFAKALDYLWDGIYDGKDYKSEYICHAINRTPLNIAAPATRRGADAAMVIVCNRLGGQHTVVTWLEDVAKIPYNEMTCENVQAYRKRWLEALAKEFSK